MNQKTVDTLNLVAFIFDLLATIGTCWLVIPLVWTIPMTIHAYQVYKGERELRLAFSIWELIVLCTVSGVCHLVIFTQTDD